MPSPTSYKRSVIWQKNVWMWTPISALYMKAINWIPRSLKLNLINVMLSKSLLHVFSILKRNYTGYYLAYCKIVYNHIKRNESRLLSAEWKLWFELGARQTNRTEYSESNLTFHTGHQKMLSFKMNNFHDSLSTGLFLSHPSTIRLCVTASATKTPSSVGISETYSCLLMSVNAFRVAYLSNSPKQWDAGYNRNRHLNDDKWRHLYR